MESFIASLSNKICTIGTSCSNNFNFNCLLNVFPNNGIQLFLTAIASNGPSTNVIGCSKLMNNSNPIIFFDAEQLTYFNPLVSKKLLAV